MINKFKNMLEGAIALTRDHQTNAAAAQCAQIVAMYAQVIARAKAAENGLADLTERHENEMAKLIALVPSLRQRAEKAETRLAELEAAARWRPVSEKPGRAGYYKTACIDLPSETDRVYYSRVGGWDYDIDFWQPLPAGGNGQKENEMVETADNESTALMARIDELEEFARWRPISRPPLDDKPVLALLESGEYKVARYVVIGDINGVPLHLWCGTGGASKHVAYWRPIIHHIKGE